MIFCCNEILMLCTLSIHELANVTNKIILIKGKKEDIKMKESL